ncbi:MAG: hypothetical protein LAP21_24180, partial [Acidobacteriia bacterium]|nr:hypothetical protein [Terriglobia bacterium]
LRKRASDREKYEAIAYPRPLTERPLLVPHKDHPDYGKPILDENGKPLFQTPERQCVMKGCDHELISPGLLPEDLRKEVTCGQHNDEERKTSTRRGPKGINRQKIQRFLRKRPDALTDGERQKIERLLSATPPTRRELKRRILQKYFTAEQRKQIIPQHITRDAWRVYFKWKTKNGTTSTECYQLRDLY